MDTNKDIFSKIKFIGKIQIGDKVSLKEMQLQNDGLLTPIYRVLYQENRYKTLVFINDTINKSFELIRCYSNSAKQSDKIMCIHLLDDLKASRNGLSNLKETYSKDIKFTCDINVLLQTIDAGLVENGISIEKDSNIFNNTSPKIFIQSPLPPPPPPLQYGEDCEGVDL